MKNNLLLSFLLSIYSTLLYTQKSNLEFSKSEIFNDEYKESKIILVENSKEDEITFVRSYKNSGISLTQGFYIEKYTSNLKLKKDFDYIIKHPISHKHNTVLKVFYQKNSINIIEIYYDIKLKVYTCESHIIDSDFSTSKKKLFQISIEEIKKHGSISLENKFYESKHDSFFNDDTGDFAPETIINYNWFKNKEPLQNEKNIVVQTNIDKNSFVIALNFNNSKSNFLKGYTFNSDFEKTNDFLIENDKKEYCSIHNIQISDDGKTCFLLSKKKPCEEEIYELTQITQNSKKTKLIDIQDYFIPNLRMLIKDKHLILVGFSGTKKANSYEGVSFIKIDMESLETKTLKHSLFSNHFLIDKYGKTNKKEVSFLTMKNIIFNSSDELYITGEEQYSRTGGNNNIYYSFDDIVVLKLNFDGSLLWSRNINKRQNSGTMNESSFSSFSSILSNDKLHLFINSNDKINKINQNTIEFIQGSTNKSNLNVITFNEDGTFDFKKILDDSEKEVPFMTSKAVATKNKIYFLGKKGKNKQLLKVVL